MEDVWHHRRGQEAVPHLAWKGVDDSGQDYGDEWTAKKNVVRKDRREWEAYVKLENEG